MRRSLFCKQYWSDLFHDHLAGSFIVAGGHGVKINSGCQRSYVKIDLLCSRLHFVCRDIQNSSTVTCVAPVAGFG